MKKKSIWARFLFRIFPWHDPITGEFIRDPEKALNPYLLRGSCCETCGAPFYKREDEPCDEEKFHRYRCSDCVKSKDVALKNKSLYHYRKLVREMMVKFKFGSQFHFLTWIKTPWQKFLEERVKDWKIDFIIPIPVSQKRLRERGFNQSLLLAKTSHIPVIKNVLRDQGNRKIRQSHLSKAERLKNKKGSFVLSEKYHEVLRDKRVLLVDDVWTTGATIREAAKVLTLAGVREVKSVTLAIGQASGIGKPHVRSDS
jgi:competence protein ComFC